MPKLTGAPSRFWFRIEKCPSPSTYRLFTPASWPRCGARVALGAVGSAWGPALGRIWDFIRSHPGLRTDSQNIFLYHHPAQHCVPILCDFGVEVTRTFETAGEVYATEPPGGQVALPSTAARTAAWTRRTKRIEKWMRANRGGWTIVGDLWRSDAGYRRN